MPGFQELIVIAVVALLVFGPNRLPELARNAAQVIARLRVETQRSVGELKRAASVDGLDRELDELRREFREARDAVTRPTRASSPSAVAAAGPGAQDAARDEERPPPVDPEAT